MMMSACAGRAFLFATQRVGEAKIATRPGA